MNRTSSDTFEHDCSVKVRYSETDQMGFAYYSRYFEWFEQARTELLERLGYPYDRMESELGLFLPVLSASINYRRPVRYNERIRVNTVARRQGNLRIRFDYRVFDSKEELCATGETVLAFINRDGRPEKRGAEFLDEIFS